MEKLVHGLYTLELSPKSTGGTFTIETMCNSTIPTDSAMNIECDGSIPVEINGGETVFIEFNNTKKQNVLFTNCPESTSDGWTGWYSSTDAPDYSMFLRNSSGTLIQSKSLNECDGTDCFFATAYCPYDNAETFVMHNLSEDVYRIEVTHLWHSELLMSELFVGVVCDPILCNEYQYEDLYVESDAYFSYRCNQLVDGADALNYQFCYDGESEMTETEVHSLNSFYDLIHELGLGIQNNVLLVSLLFVNVSISVFIIIGLNRISIDVDVRTISTVILITQLILSTSLLSFNPFQFGSCILMFDGQGLPIPTIFHLLIALICSVLCHVWANYACDECCCCKYSLAVLSLTLFLLLATASAVFSVRDNELVVFLFLFFQSLVPVLLCKLTPRCESVCKRKLCLPVTSLLSAFVAYVLTVNTWGSVCLIAGGASWFNPFFVFSSFYLFLSEFRILIIFQNFILLIIFLSQQFNDSDYFCSIMVNVQYIAHSFLIPIYIFLLFKSVPRLRGLATSLIGLFLVAVDVYSDLVVVYVFFEETEYIFAILQVSFIITGQVVGATSDVFGEHSENLSVIDKVTAFFGFGRIWFTVNWWNEVMTQDGMGKYKVLRQKHKIWDLLYEAFPTVTLQVFAAMTSDVALTALVASITISAVSVSFSTIRYLRDLLAVQQQDNDTDQRAPALRITSVSTEYPLNRDQRPEEAKSIYLTLFVFLISDFYIRSVPTVMMLAMVSITWFDGDDGRDYFLRFIFGSFMFGVMAIFELIANHKIRMESHRGLKYILKIFVASIFSSFYTMLCTLNVLQMDPFYAESVIFSRYLVEHGIRCVVALIFCICSLALSDGTLWYPWALTVLFLFAVSINGVMMRWIYSSEFVSKIEKNVPPSMEHVTAELEHVGSMTTAASSKEQYGSEGQGFGTKSEIQSATTELPGSIELQTMTNGKDSNDGAVVRNLMAGTQDTTNVTMDTDTDLDINVLDEENGSHSNEI